MNILSSSGKVYSDLKQLKMNVHICRGSCRKYHSHYFFELAYVVSGNVAHRLDGEERLLKKGDYLIMDYNAHHSYVKKMMKSLK